MLKYIQARKKVRSLSLASIYIMIIKRTILPYPMGTPTVPTVFGLLFPIGAQAGAHGGGPMCTRADDPLCCWQVAVWL